MNRLRARSTSSQKNNHNEHHHHHHHHGHNNSDSGNNSNSNTPSSTSRATPSSTKQQQQPASLSDLLRMTNNNRPPHHNRKSATSDEEGGDDDSTDDDDDLRSLLSGNSLDKVRAQLNNPHRQKQNQQQKQIQERQGTSQEGADIARVSSQSSDDNISINNNNNSNMNLTPNRAKKTLWLLGTIILAVGFLGPSGLLWDMLEEDTADDDTNNDSPPFRTQHQQFMGMHGVSAHGDKHHHIPPPPQSGNMNHDMENVHPMLRNAAAVDKASSSSNHRNKFGRHEKESRNKNNRGKRNRKGDKDTNGWGIKDAIHNIDKVFMDHRPTAGTTTTVKKKKFHRDKEETTDDNAVFFSSTDDEEEFLPVVHQDETLPENAENIDAYTYSLPASDALECRASVVAFVINATDVKDECDGLRKAFDKTCSVHAGPAVAVPVVVEDEEPHGTRRRLSERGRPHLWNLMPEAFERRIREAGGRLMRSPLQRRLKKEKKKRRLQEEKVGSGGKSGSRGHHNEERKMEEDDPEEPDEGAPVVQQKQQHQKQEQAPPMISLNIPTAEKHISEEVLNDALLLQQSGGGEAKQQQSANSAEDDAPSEQQHQTQQEEQSSHYQTAAHDSSQPHNQQSPQPPPPAVQVNPNITAGAAEAIQDAAESSEAIRTAVEGVKNVMNDPKSIEARTCCASILSVFHEHCDPTTTGVEDYSDRRLLVVVFVITVCGIVKSVIRHLNIRWLPEAGGCILVGVFGYLILEHMPHVQFAFDGDMFLRIMVPPIVFEAAVKINKQSFRRHVLPICIFAIVGTLASTAFTAFILHKGSGLLRGVTTIPIMESLVFGALISSIDPIAVLSILNSMGMTDTDTIYVLIFGESLLNDGVAIVLFQTLVHFLDETLVIDAEVVLDAVIHFVVVAVGSVTVGAASGAFATVYFAMMHGCQTPMVEVIMFCCWSFIPYYICDMVEWSGIVAIVANGFVMDLYVIGQKQQQHDGSSNVDDEIDFLVNGTNANSNGRVRHNRQSQCRSIFSFEGHLSSKADSHVHFVIEIFATLMETAIFAYLGLFLFSPRYHWSGYLTFISISATVMGRVIMIPLFSHVSNIFNRMGQSNRNNRSPTAGPANNNEGVHIDPRMQLVLVFAGLRGAMSFALVEHIPMFDTTTGQGSRFKPELKAMTSASVIFTVFILGGATSYLMEKLGYSTNKQQQQHDALEIVPLVQNDKRKSPAAAAVKRNGMFPSSNESSLRNNGSVRQRGPR